MPNVHKLLRNTQNQITNN